MFVLELGLSRHIGALILGAALVIAAVMHARSPSCLSSADPIGTFLEGDANAGGSVTFPGP